MEVIEQTSNRLIIVRRNNREGRLLGLAGAIFCLAVCVLLVAFMFTERGRGINVGIIISSVMVAGMLFLACICLSTFWYKETYTFDKAADSFMISERSLRGRKTTGGTISGILSTNLKIDYSPTDSEASPSSEIIIRYNDGTSPKTITCGSGIVDADRCLHQTLKTFLKR
ncbi:MAG TPA: hypothetical protein VK363_14445 [Pyrinomonadaceae bacterium]|nr:hypothetical protein [Pyrinomonadaceae bacterium]